MGQIGHPNIMRLYDAIDTQRQLNLVLENCNGKMLNEILKESTITTRKSLTE